MTDFDVFFLNTSLEIEDHVSAYHPSCANTDTSREIHIKSFEKEVENHIYFALESWFTGNSSLQRTSKQ